MTESISYAEDDPERRTIVWLLEEYYIQYSDAAIISYINDLQDINVIINITNGDHHCNLIRKAIKYMSTNCDKYSHQDMTYLIHMMPRFPVWLREF